MDHHPPPPPPPPPPPEDPPEDPPPPPLLPELEPGGVELEAMADESPLPMDEANDAALNPLQVDEW